MKSRQYILVTGATGQQGGAVARHLLNQGFRVKALTRNAASAPAQALQAMGATIVQGDFEKKEELLAALEGCDTLFSVQNYWEKGVGYEGEIRQARNLLEAARQMHIQHIVQASIADCDHAPGVKHIESKYAIEKMIQTSGIPYTLLRTVMFMENFVGKYPHLILAFLAGVLPAHFKLHLTTVDDIGAIAATVISVPEKYQGRIINIASDIATLSEIKQAYKENLSNKVLDYKIPAWFGSLINQEFTRQLQWNKTDGWKFPLSETREVLPHLTSIREFFRKASNHVPAASIA